MSHNKVDILTNSEGNRTTPSYVSFGEERLIGDAAKNQAARNPENTVYLPLDYWSRIFAFSESAQSAEAAVLSKCRFF